MSIRDHLKEGETILSDHKPFYATSQRLIHYQEKVGEEKVEELLYTRLTSVEVVRLPRHRVMIGGTMAVLGGLYLATLGFFTAWLAIALGAGALVYGAMGREAYYQFHAYGMTKTEEVLWRIECWGSGSFISTIRNIIGERPERWG